MPTSSSGQRSAVVTGAAQGIGAAIAARLAQDGLAVLLADLPGKQAALDALAEQIVAAGGRATTFAGDVSVEENVKRMVSHAMGELGPLGVFVANAGLLQNTPILDTTVEDLERIMSVNFRGTFLCYREAAAQMIKQGSGGRIIGACSVAGKQGMADFAVYGASKFAVRGLTQSAALEFGKHGITVNAYAPGAIETPMTLKYDAINSQRAGKPLGTITEKSRAQTAVGRIGTPDDIAELVSYLASDAAAFVTGQSVMINGGTIFD